MILFNYYCAFNDYIVSLGLPSIYWVIIGIVLGFIIGKVIKPLKNLAKKENKNE